MPQLLASAYWKRFFIALFAASVLVFACSLSMQLHALKDPERILLVGVGVFLVSLPGAALSAFVFQRNQLALVLGAQILTVIGLAAWFGLRT